MSIAPVDVDNRPVACILILFSLSYFPTGNHGEQSRRGRYLLRDVSWFDTGRILRHLLPSSLVGGVFSNIFPPAGTLFEEWLVNVAAMRFSEIPRNGGFTGFDLFLIGLSAACPGRRICARTNHDSERAALVQIRVLFVCVCDLSAVDGLQHTDTSEACNCRLEVRCLGSQPFT